MSFIELLLLVVAIAFIALVIFPILVPPPESSFQDPRSQSKKSDLLQDPNDDFSNDEPS